MKIEAVKVAFPSRKISNQDIISLVEKNSKEIYQGELEKALRHISLLLRHSGSQYRCWLEENETPLQLLSKAVDEALQEADCSKQDIDLLIYAGVNGGFNEPSNAHMVAYSLGIEKADCFDVVEACMSWTRAIYLTYYLLQTGIYKRAMIVNAEFNLMENGAIYPGCFKLENLEQVSWSIPGYTVGEAATATIFSSDLQQDWEFHFDSRPDLADLSTVPRKGYQKYCSPSSKIGRNGAEIFTCFGREMHKDGQEAAVKIFQQLKTPIEEVKAVFPHASSKKAWDEFGELLGIQHLLFHIYPDFGNVVSASIPAGIATAINEKKIHRGERLVGWVGSAGMSFCAFSFTY